MSESRRRLIDAIDVAFQCPDAKGIKDGQDDEPSARRALSKVKCVQKTTQTVQEIIKEACEESWKRINPMAEEFQLSGKNVAEWGDEDAAAKTILKDAGQD